ncbi:hypothetical protein BDR03DRAFT_943412 [Suillus americanus]|nr:hypothetical protein BDR03DRAFT_943412 [Suillus americanus]
MSLPVPLEPRLALASFLHHWKRVFRSLICFLKMCWLLMECHVLDTFCASLSLPLDLYIFNAGLSGFRSLLSHRTACCIVLHSALGFIRSFLAAFQLFR